MTPKSIAVTHLRHLVFLAVFLACVVWVTPTRADVYGDTCAILGPAGQYIVAATEELQFREYFPNEVYVPYPQVSDRICAPNIKSGKVAWFWNDMVATASEGTAISFGVLTRRIGGPCLCGYYDGYPCNANYIVYGDIVTGGGAVKARPNILPKMSPGQAVDTTGAHPQVAQCASAIPHLFAASDALAQGLLPGEPPAAARPIIDLGDLSVSSDSTVTLSATPGAPITFYRARNVTLYSGKRQAYSGYSYVTEGGRLALDGDSDQLVILNVTGRLRMGRNSYVDSEAGATLVNVIGSGPGIVVQRGTAGGILLAPHRVIRLRALGGGPELYYASAGQLFGRKVKMTGSAVVGTYFGAIDPEYCGFAPD